MNITWLILAGVLAIIAVVFFYLSAQKKKSEPQPPRQRQDPLKFADGSDTFNARILGPGAIISRGGVDYVCRGAIQFRQGQYIWHEYLLDGGKGSEYLSVEYDEGQLNLGWWITRPDLAQQPAHDVTVEGVRYRKTESGVGTFTSEGTTGVADQGEFEYWDLAEAGGNRLLSFERYGKDSPFEVSLGWTVLPGELTVYPAPEAS
ncbi:DUF4178 domain-containing protein [Corynebacterium glutamicum]|uniref:DUF4178 domain-containing protein n=1 Tax=Corynebacterium glutamicum TaxID=1718 RepID=UPI00097AA248|nr:DUF4178 domain-containing protein [Corynebacterium glutamicum]GAV98197.1 hypothetical protein CS176_2427 [Corynebacterium glutamicum]